MAYGKTIVNKETGERTRSGMTPGGRDYKVTKNKNMRKTIVTDRPGTFTNQGLGAGGVKGERHYESVKYGQNKKAKKSVTTDIKNVGSAMERKNEKYRTVAKGPTKKIAPKYASGKRLEPKKK